MTAGRKTTPAATSREVPINEALVRADFDTVAVLGAQEREREDAQLAQAAQAVGGALMARLHKNFSHAAEVGMFMQVRDLPLAVLRRIPIPKTPDASGSFGGVPQGEAGKTPDTSGNLDDFCRRVFGRSYNTMLEEAQNFHTLGEAAYETSARLGLSKSSLRVTRALPPEKLEVVRAAIGNGSTKAEVLSVIEDLAEKVEQAEAATAEARAELKASEEVLATKSKTIDKLHRDLKRIEKLPPDEQLAGLKKEATAIAAEAEGFVLGGLRQALIALANHGDERGAHGVFMAGLVGQVQAQLAALREEFNLPDVSEASAGFEDEASQAIRAGLAQMRAKSAGGEA